VWFYRIAVREAMRLDRKRAMLTFFATDPVASADPGESIERLDVRRALGRLSRVQRAAIVLHYYADMNSREIAAVLGIPSATVRFHLASARRKLEIMLGDARLPARLLEVVNGAH
jgi:RNA polymerase sigma-70 factor (ECF subfamily)